MERSSPDTPMLNNRYKLLNNLGAGGMAVVYRAQDIMLERPVAIKLLRQDFSGNHAFREQFKHEAKSAANLSHPNIVTVHDFGFDAGRLFIVMEFIPGTDLKTLIKQRKVFSVTEATNLITQACAGIGYAHRSGIVHCDVKPHNMLVTPDHRLKVTDFGIARALSTINPDEHTDEVWGSPQYFSPEQASGSAPSPASDVYSLGVVLYEMLTGQLPFTASDPQDLARQHRNSRPIPPARLNHEIPAELEQIILKVLSKEPAQRYRTADQLGRLLAPFAGFSDNLPPIIPAVESYQPVAPERASTPVRAPARPATQAQPVQTWNSPAYMPVAPQAQPQPRADESVLPSIFSPDILILAIIAIILWVGIIPFSAYVLLQLGLI